MIGFEGLPPEYIAKSVVRSLQSTMPCHNKAFPTIPEFAADARNLIGADYAKSKRHRDGLAQIENQAPEVSEDSRARVGALLKSLSKELTAKNEPARAPRFSEMSANDAAQELHQDKDPHRKIEISESLKRNLDERRKADGLGNQPPNSIGE